MLTIKTKVLLIILFSPIILKAQVTVNSLFTNHMVMQQKAKVKIWGKASAQEPITLRLSFLKKDIKITADNQGNWETNIHTPKHGGPYKMLIEGAKNKITVEDIYLGEVWLASGQSNMQYPIDSNSKGYYGVNNFKEEVKKLNQPLIRQFVVKGTIARTETDALAGEWLLSQPQNAKKLSALAYFYALELQKNLNVPIGIINASWGGTHIAAWTAAKDLKPFESDFAKLQKITASDTKVNENYPSVLYNGMINPLKNMTVKGVIWCQGENNINDPRDYALRMKSLINGWRESFNSNFPFLYVQIAPFNYLGRPRQYFSGTENSLGYLVEQQTKALKIKHTFMARTGDVGNVKNIHYQNKQEVAYRLSCIALKEVYRKDKGIVNGPNVSKIDYQTHQIIINYSNVGKGLTLKGDALNGFELSEDGISFYPAKAKIKANKVIIPIDKSAKINAIRYCFKNIQEVNLFNATGFPALPFRTDKIAYIKPD